MFHLHLSKEEVMGLTVRETEAVGKVVQEFYKQGR